MLQYDAVTLLDSSSRLVTMVHLGDLGDNDCGCTLTHIICLWTYGRFGEDNRGATVAFSPAATAPTQRHVSISPFPFLSDLPKPWLPKGTMSLAMFPKLPRPSPHPISSFRVTEMWTATDSMTD